MAKKGPKKGTEEYAKLLKEIRHERNRIQQFVHRASKRGYSFSSNAVPTIPDNITEKTLQKFKSIRPQTLYKKAIYVSPEGITIKGTVRKKQELSEASKKGAETKRRNYVQNLLRMSREADRALEEYREEYPELEPYDSDDFWRDYYEQYADGTAPTSETDTVLQQLESMINNWQPMSGWSPSLVIFKTHDKNLLKSTLEGIINRDGREAVAQRCQDNAEILVSIANQVLYGSGNDYKVRGVDGVNQDIQLFATIIGGRSPTVAESMEFTAEAEATAVSYDE